MHKLDLEKKIDSEYSGKKIKPEIKAGGLDLERKQEFEKEKSLEKSKKKELIPAEVWQPKGKPSVGAPGIDISDSPLHQNVEAILEDGLEDLYFSMDENRREIFKKKGEETTSKIIQLVKNGKATFKKVFKLILSWLRFIPGVNKYFLEQEAKIKADRILEIQ